MLYVQGPGGIGKTAVIRRAASEAVDLGYELCWLDGREVAPLAEAVDDALSPALAASRPLVVVDSYERIGALDPHVRAELLPRLPDTARVVIAGRLPPEPGWREAGWQALFEELRIGPLSDEDAFELLARYAITGDAASQIVGWAAGSALGLTLAATVARGTGQRTLDLERPEITGPLIRALAEPDIQAAHLPALGVLSIARQATPGMLADVLGAKDPEAELEWLASLGFTEPVGSGIAAHEIVRRALHADLRDRDPELERELRRRIAEHLHGRALASGDMLMTIDLAHLAESPRLRMGFSWEAAARYRVDETREGDLESIAATLGGQGARLGGTARFLAEAPEHVTVCRNQTGSVAGFAIAVTPATAPPFADDDPILGPRLEHARTRSALGESIVWRNNLDLRGRRDSGVIALLGIASILRATSGNPRFGYLPIPAGDPATAFAAEAGAHHVPSLDAVRAHAVIECHLLDWGEGGLVTAQRDFVYRELGRTPPPPPDRPSFELESVREALRLISNGSPRELSECGLARSGVARGVATGERAASLRSAIEAAAQRAFTDDPHDRLLLDVLTSNYLDPEDGPELAAERLHMSRSSYFRRLREAVSRLTDELAAAVEPS